MALIFGGEAHRWMDGGMEGWREEGREEGREGGMDGWMDRSIIFIYPWSIHQPKNYISNKKTLKTIYIIKNIK